MSATVLHNEEYFPPLFFELAKADCTSVLKYFLHCKLCIDLLYGSESFNSVSSRMILESTSILITCYALFLKSDWLVALLFLLK